MLEALAVQWSLWPSRGARKLSRTLRRALTSHFHLSLEELADLRYVSRPDSLLGRPLRRVLIFNPALLGQGVRRINRYNDLWAQGRAVIFEGHIDSDGTVHLSESRPLLGTA